MAIHPPKRINSAQGLGLNTKKRLQFINDTLAIGTETWGYLDTPWQEGMTIIAEDGYKWVTRWEADRPFIITKFYDTNDTLAGIYCDIAKPVTRTDDGFEFYDMYLDVWQAPGSQVVILDEDELNEALLAEHITKAEFNDAQQAAQEVMTLFNTRSPMFNF